MNIAYITCASPTDDWGHSVQIVNMCKSFSRNQAHVTLIVPYRKVFSTKDVFEHYKIPKTFSVKFLPCIDFFYTHPHPLLYWLRFISFYISARVYVWFHRFDVLYSRDLYSVLFFPSIVLEQHSLPKKMSLLHTRVFRHAKKIVVLTSFIKKRLGDIGVSLGNVLVSHDAVDPKQFVAQDTNFTIVGIKESDFVYGYIGTLKTMGMEKGVSDGLKALSFLPENFKFLIVGGEVADVKFYKKIAEEFGVSDRAVFIGKVSHHDISKYAQVCDVFVAPFPENEHYNFYMSPLKIFEYMASKKPIVTTDLPSLREVLTSGKNAVLIKPSDPKLLAETLIKIEQNPEYGQKLAEEAYKEVLEKYTWDIRAKHIIDFIRV